MSLAIWIIAALVAGCASMLDLAAGRIVPAAALWIIASACVAMAFHGAKTRAAAATTDAPLCHACKRSPIDAAWAPTCGPNCWQGYRAVQALQTMRERGGRRCDA